MPKPCFTRYFDMRILSDNYYGLKNCAQDEKQATRQHERHRQGKQPGQGDVHNGFALQVLYPALCNHRTRNTRRQYVGGTNWQT